MLLLVHTPPITPPPCSHPRLYQLYTFYCCQILTSTSYFPVSRSLICVATPLKSSLSPRPSTHIDTNLHPVLLKIVAPSLRMENPRTYRNGCSKILEPTLQVRDVINHLVSFPDTPFMLHFLIDRVLFLLVNTDVTKY
jgi:hypothetical protein